MGETATNTANVNMQEGLAMGVEEGCLLADPCASHVCPKHSHCSDLWNAFSCVCDPGAGTETSYLTPGWCSKAPQ